MDLGMMDGWMMICMDVHIDQCMNDGWMDRRTDGWTDERTDRHTCCHKEDSSAEQDVVLGAVDASDANTQAAQHQQDGAEDGKQAGGSNDSCSHETKCIALNVHETGISLSLGAQIRPPHKVPRSNGHFFSKLTKLTFVAIYFFYFFLLLQLILTPVKSCCCSRIRLILF